MRDQQPRLNSEDTPSAPFSKSRFYLRRTSWPRLLHGLRELCLLLYAFMTQDRAQLFDLSQAGRYRDRELSNNTLLSAHAHTTVGYLFQVVEENQRQVRSFKTCQKAAPRAALGRRTGGKLGKHSGLGQRDAHCYTGISVIVIKSCASPLAAIRALIRPVSKPT